MESEDLMSDTNKILDVTYGTFSCRLEGFDDSVETMKTVVTFFHELAGHDRFMDMTPQAPDLETLAELTGREAGVDVDAHTEDGGLVLRARPTDTPEDARPSLRIQHPAAERSEAEALSPSIFEDDTAAETPDETAEEPEATVHTGTLSDTSGTAATFDDDPADAEYSDEIDDEIDESATFEPDPAPEDLQATKDSAESVAEKLQRIRAVVGRNETPKTDDTYAEDLTEQTGSATPAPANPLAQRLAELAQRNATLGAQEATQDDVAEDDALTDEEISEVTAEDSNDVSKATGESETVTMQPDDIAENAASDESTDDSDDDDDLHEQVAEVERAIALRRENRSKRDELPRNVDAAMSRILSQADEHLNEPEGRRHRDTIAQLKAAVAATQAARQLGDAGNGERDLGDVFREDLDAHEAEEEAETEENTDAAQDTEQTAATDETPVKSPAPLRLVAAQRVDEPEKTIANPADRLRQIASKKNSAQETSGGFAEFAAQQGATELGDLLEAAAAYIAFVEGDADFSRPQVMRKVQMATADEFSREEGLRSFGRLLRQSRIIKLDNGRFQVSEDTKFRPDDQAAQG